LHCDVWTSPIMSNSGFKFYLVILDDYSHYAWTFPLRHKSDVLPTLISFNAFVRTQFQVPIMSFQTDNGREFDNSASRAFFATHGIALRLTCPYTSQQNGRAERVLRTLNDGGPMLLWPPPISSIGDRADPVTTRLPSSSSSARHLSTTISGCLGAYVIPISRPLHRTNSRRVQCAAFSLAIPLIKKDTSAITWKANELLSHVTSTSTRPVFHLCRTRQHQHRRPLLARHACQTRF
jgi:transposase InsO family protein